MPSQNSSSVLIVAAEASSALYAQRLMEYWQKHNATVDLFGVGSKEMEKLGFERLGKSENMAVVGLQEVLAHYSEIKACFDSLVTEAKERKPKFALLLDYPEFNLKLAAKLKEMDIPVIYYISPQVWAWRKSRIHKIKKLVDKMLVLFPFEKPFYEQHGVPVEFVGHPLLDEIAEKYSDQDYRKECRRRYGFDSSDIVLGLMPGSRRSEIKHHLDLQMATAREIVAKQPRVRPALLIAPTLDADEIKSLLPDFDFPLVIMQEEPNEMINVCDDILCASGTATLMVALMQKPMVIMYKMNQITAWMAKLFVRSTRFFGMVNLISEELVAPEFFQEKATAQILSRELLKIIEDKAATEGMTKKLERVKTLLGDHGATERVAKNLEEYLG